MAELFFEKPILNSPYEYPARHWELPPDGQPTISWRNAELPRALEAIKLAGASAAKLDDMVSLARGAVAVSAMLLAKGLEFHAVAVMACDDEVIPLQSRVEAIADEADLEEVYNTERHLLYGACTRARDQLLVSGVSPASKFLDDLLAPGGGEERLVPRWGQVSRSSDTWAGVGNVRHS